MRGYDFISEKVWTVDKFKDKDVNPMLVEAIALSYALNQPVIVKDFQQFFNLARMFKSTLLVVYADPKDRQSYDEVLRSLIEARSKLPIKVGADNDGDLNINRE